MEIEQLEKEVSKIGVHEYRVLGLLLLEILKQLRGAQGKKKRFLGLL